MIWLLWMATAGWLAVTLVSFWHSSSIERGWDQIATQQAADPSDGGVPKRPVEATEGFVWEDYARVG
jgi:hypothetical protein